MSSKDHGTGQCECELSYRSTVRRRCADGDATSVLEVEAGKSSQVLLRFSTMFLKCSGGRPFLRGSKMRSAPEPTVGSSQLYSGSQIYAFDDRPR